MLIICSSCCKQLHHVRRGCSQCSKPEKLLYHPTPLSIALIIDDLFLALQSFFFFLECSSCFETGRLLPMSLLAGISCNQVGSIPHLLHPFFCFGIGWRRWFCLNEIEYLFYNLMGLKYERYNEFVRAFRRIIKHSFYKYRDESYFSCMNESYLKSWISIFILLLSGLMHFYV